MSPKTSHEHAQRWTSQTLIERSFQSSTKQESEEQQRRSALRMKNYHLMFENEKYMQQRKELQMQRMHSQRNAEILKLYDLKRSAGENLSKLKAVAQRAAAAEAAESHRLAIWEIRRRELVALIEKELMEERKAKDLNGSHTYLHSKVRQSSDKVLQLLRDSYADAQFKLNNDKSSMETEEILPDVSSESNSEHEAAKERTTNIDDTGKDELNEGEDGVKRQTPQETYRQKYLQKMFSKNEKLGNLSDIRSEKAVVKESTEEMQVKQPMRNYGRISKKIKGSNTVYVNKSTSMVTARKHPTHKEVAEIASKNPVANKLVDMELAFIKTTEDRYVPVRVINQTYEDFDDMLEIETV